MNDIQRLYSALMKRYPNVNINIDQDSEGNPIIDIDTSETNFYIVQRPNGKFSVNAVWSGDEKGKKNLSAQDLVKALDSIPGMRAKHNVPPPNPRPSGQTFTAKKPLSERLYFCECCNTFRLSEGILPDDWEAKADKNRDEREKTDKEIVMDDGDFLKIWWYKSIPEIEGAIKRFERSKEINIAGMRAMRRNSMFLQIYKRFDLQAKSKLKYLNGILKSKKTDPNFVPDHYKEAVLEIRSTIDARSLSKKLKDYKAKVDSLGLGAFKELKHHPDVIYYKKLLKMKKDFIDKSLGEPIQSKEDIQKLYAALTKKYPNIQIGIDQDSEGNPIIDVDSGETTFYIVQKPNGRFAINAVWSGDETGRKNLDAASMIKSLDSIPGMKDSMNESMSDSEILKSQLANEQEFLKNDYDRYMECMNNKPLKDRKTPQEIRDGLILYWHVYRHIVDKED